MQVLLCGRDSVNTLVRRWRRMQEDSAQRRRQMRMLSLEALEDRYLLSTGFTQVNLDSDVPGLARVTDPNLVNPWGIAFSPTGAFWFGDNGTSVSDVVDGNGQLLPVVVRVPGANGNPGTPTGTVYNGGSGYQVTANGLSGPARFLFASEDGTISAWNPQVDFGHAFVVIDNSTHGADYMGLALAGGADGNTYLYAADFGRGQIDVFDQNFHQVVTTGSFTDPNLPPGFAPFNVQNIDGQLFVAYAKKDAAGNDDAPGAGNGFIDVFSPSGDLVERVASGGALNSPWGMAVAPQSFGSFGGALLVGNNGDGRINAYNLASGTYLGQLTDNAGNPIVISGLWGLTVGNDHLAGNSQTLFFAAGINHEQHGLFGAIQNSHAGQSGTSGTLPYDPNSDGDDYPLPPARGPALGNDFGQSTPTPVLLSANNSSFALAPTLSLSSEPSGNLAALSLLPVRSSTVLDGTQDSPTPEVALGSIPSSGALTAFSPTSPMTPISADRPTVRISSPVDWQNADVSAPFSLLFLDQYPLLDFTESEGVLTLVSAELSPIHPQTDFRAESREAFLQDYLPNDLENGWTLDQIMNSSSEVSQSKGTNRRSRSDQQSMSSSAPADIVISDLAATPFSVSVLRGLFPAVAACLPWGHYGASRLRDRSVPMLHE